MNVMRPVERPASFLLFIEDKPKTEFLEFSASNFTFVAATIVEYERNPVGQRQAVFNGYLRPGIGNVSQHAVDDAVAVVENQPSSFQHPSALSACLHFRHFRHLTLLVHNLYSQMI